MKIVYANLSRLNGDAVSYLHSQPPEELPLSNPIEIYKTKRVREHLLRYLTPSIHILEMNSGTGEDAIYLAQLGHQVHTTNQCHDKQLQLIENVNKYRLDGFISNELSASIHLSDLQNQGPFDHIFFNFGGLNCIEELDQIFQIVPGLLKANGLVTVVVQPRFCLWEALLILKGKLRLVTRRWLNSSQKAVHSMHSSQACRYYNPSYIIKRARKNFDLLETEGLCTIVPPSYMDKFPDNHPRLYQLFVSLEDRLKNNSLVNSCGDYYIMSLRKR